MTFQRPWPAVDCPKPPSCPKEDKHFVAIEAVAPGAHAAATVTGCHSTGRQARRRCVNRARSHRHNISSWLSMAGSRRSKRASIRRRRIERSLPATQCRFSRLPRNNRADPHASLNGNRTKLSHFFTRKRLVRRKTGESPEISKRDFQDGAQGRNRTTDTAIFSRMLYQLSYLGAWPDGPWLMPKIGR